MVDLAPSLRSPGCMQPKDTALKPIYSLAARQDDGDMRILPRSIGDGDISPHKDMQREPQSSKAQKDGDAAAKGCICCQHSCSPHRSQVTCSKMVQGLLKIAAHPNSLPMLLIDWDAERDEAIRRLDSRRTSERPEVPWRM